MGLKSRNISNLLQRFQSTHPVWDGTDRSRGQPRYSWISIHPSRVGWDVDFCSVLNSGGTFQSTHPVWDGTSTRYISSATLTHFNPPIPCGMGLVSANLTSSSFVFQSTHPVWDGTTQHLIDQRNDQFQSTHPVWDGTNTRKLCLLGCSQFQSTHPVWDGTGLDDDASHNLLISIHPSRVGWDKQWLDRIYAQTISIHPSRVGWDEIQFDRDQRSTTFQSTHPVWDGTLSGFIQKTYPRIVQSTQPVWDGTRGDQSGSASLRHCNPPIPCGMGRSVLGGLLLIIVISIHPSRVGWDHVAAHPVRQ